MVHIEPGHFADHDLVALVKSPLCPRRSRISYTSLSPLSQVFAQWASRLPLGFQHIPDVFEVLCLQTRKCDDLTGVINIDAHQISRSVKI